MSKLLSDPAIIAGAAVLITALAALIQAKSAEIKANVAEKHAIDAQATVKHVQEQTSAIDTKLAVTTEQVTVLKEKSKQ